MADYTIRFILPSGGTFDTYPLSLWAGNRALTNRAAISIAQTFYAALAYRDEDSRIALWSALGNTGEAKLDEMIGVCDWKDGAATMDYPMNGKVLTAVFTMNAELGQKFCPLEDLHIAKADKGFEIAFQSARSVAS